MTTRKPPAAAEPRMRLLDVAVQARFVYDDGATLKEVVGQPVRVTADTWPAFAANSFSPDDLEVARLNYEAQQAGQG